MERAEQGREDECITGLIPKGRRTKRYRPPFPSALQVDGTCYQSNGSPSPVIGSSSLAIDSPYLLSSPSSQESLYEHTEEEQAVASYLLLLSNGNESPHRATPINEITPVQFAENKSKGNTSKWIGPDGRCYFRCNTCGRDFLSFQALGGHRASHKKPRLAQPKNDYNNKSGILDSRKTAEEAKEEDMLKLSMNSFSMAIAKTRIHQCTICGSKFASGQALGGHMRRHRNPTMASEATSSDVVAPDIEIIEDNVTLNENQTSPLALDLNLPAPLEEKRGSNLLISSEVDYQF